MGAVTAAANWAALAGFFKSLAYLLAGIAFVVLAAASLLAVAGGRKLSAHIKTKLADLDMAVNGVEHGEPTLINKVRNIETTLDRICRHLRIPTHSEQEKAA